MQKIIDSVFSTVILGRNVVVYVFNCLNWIIAFAILFGSYSTAIQGAYATVSYSVARVAGEYAALLFVLVSVPGIARRFHFSHKLIMIVMMFRRQLGVLTYLLVLAHSLILRIVPWVTKLFPPTPELFVVAGIVANIMLFTLFITSNDLSVKKLSDWWGKIHRLMYIIVWFIFMHVALRGVGKWTILIGMLAVTQLASRVYASRRYKI